MRKLLPNGTIDEPQLPVFLTSWVDKSSVLCMYTMTQSRIWSVPHLKASCWYLDFPKSFCPVEEEDVKKSCNKADSKGTVTVPINAEEQDVEMEPDLSLLLKKERMKILNQKERDTKKAKVKAEKEAQKAKDKAERDAKKGERSSKSKAVVASTPTFVLPEASIGSMLQNPRKRDASFAQLSVSRLQ
jgi:cation transport ATPase